MRTWTYVEPGENDEPVVVEVTEADILKTYYPWWSEQMRRVGKTDLISDEACIEDFAVVHWASLKP